MFKKGRKVILKTVNWIIWLFFLYVTISYIPSTKEAIELSPANIDIEEWFSKIAIGVSILAIIEGALSIALRHFVLIKPARNGTFNPNTIGGGLRFTLINIANWFIAETIPVYGIVLYIMSERIEFFYAYSVAGIALLVFHSPRLSPYQTKNN